MAVQSLDLHQTARAHLFSSLLKVKTIAASPDLPEEIRAGVPKPELSEEEKILLHNVTSSLYNRLQVKQAVDQAVQAVCMALKVDMPAKGKRIRKDKREQEDIDEEATPAKAPKNGKDATPAGNKDTADDTDITDFEGFESEDDGPVTTTVDLDSEDEADEEAGFSKYNHLLGSSSDEEDDGDDGDEDDRFARYRGLEKANLDDISVSGSASEAESDNEEDAVQPSPSSSPEPEKKRAKKSESRPTKSVAPPTGSTFLPSLMGGYVSGSESASDVDVAPQKKRRGQRARRAIWEKKYGAGAKHLQEAAQSGDQGRDSGWDMRRGAVGAGDGGRRTPWKQGVNNPFEKGSNAGGRRVGRDSSVRNNQNYGNNSWSDAAPPRRPPKKDNEGTLHPSWEARKKAKDSQKGATFAGSKITFD